MKIIVGAYLFDSFILLARKHLVEISRNLLEIFPLILLRESPITLYWHQLVIILKLPVVESIADNPSNSFNRLKKVKINLFILSTVPCFFF